MTNYQNILDGTVAVIGGGVVGYFVAYRLASAGISVTLVEQGGPGSGATGNSAGNIQPASGDDDTYKIALGSESLSLWRNHLPRIKEAGKIDYLEQDVRYFYASTNPHEEQTSRQILSDLNAAGLRAEWVNGDTAREIEPRLSDSITGGTLHRDCIQMDPKLFMQAIANAAKTEGVTILHQNQATGMNLTDGRVSGVTLEDGSILQCSSVVLATGAWTKKIMSEWLGYDLPVEPHGLQKVHISLDIGTPLKCAVRWNSVNIVSRKDGLVHAGSKYDPAGFNSKPSEETRDWLLAQVAEIMPGFQPSDVDTIAAFAASTPNRIPLVGHLPGTDGVFLAVPSTDGFLMAAVLADITANLMIKGERHTLIHRSPLAQAIRR
ncbi:MAG: sarcosine oxidase subunit beta [Dehalococcoidia bacterium]|nr:MAG: sarcosine oxidase subunit beta [Dehalococcoidia bacterium]